MLARHYYWSGAVFGFQWPFHLIGLVFGALVLAPYAARAMHRAARMLGLSVASAAIYYLAVRFIVDGPLGYS
ncbi:MAG: hypothetical protein M3O07_09785, partial [Pseudomonadota bacterium]|nr:hypothetical protein [Pseudomonadota bacterium]